MKRTKATQNMTKPTAKQPAKARARVTVEKSAGAVVFHRGAGLEYLLIFSTYWEFPKGLVEPNEDEVAAATREVREETGLEIALVSGFREDITYFYRRGDKLIKKQVIYFLGEAPTRVAHLSWEHRDSKWLPYQAARNELKYDNAREILRKANDRLSERDMSR